jgi:hypothetical protein
MMWADTFEVALQCLSNSLLRECDTRIALTMNAQDSTSLIGSPSASNIEADSAILFSEQTGSAHQFRPFAWPSTEWLVTLPQSTALVPDVVTGTMQVEAPSTDPAEVKDSEESFDNDGFTLADDVVPVVSPDQTASEKMSVSETAISPDAATKSNIDTPRSEENVSSSATFDPAIGTSKSESKSVKSKSAKGNRKQTASMPETTFSHTETTSTSATESANVVASAVTTPQKPTPSLPEKRVSGMALRMSSRNSDPLRPLDAPPEPQTLVVSNEPGPENLTKWISTAF